MTNHNATIAFPARQQDLVLMVSPLVVRRFTERVVHTPFQPMVSAPNVMAAEARNKKKKNTRNIKWLMMTNLLKRL